MVLTLRQARGAIVSLSRREAGSLKCFSGLKSSADQITRAPSCIPILMVQAKLAEKIRLFRKSMQVLPYGLLGIFVITSKKEESVA